jgi:hypothetical protein
LMDSLICVLQHVASWRETKKGASWGLKMLRFRRYWTLGGKVHVARNPVLMVKKVKRGRMTRNSSSFWSWLWGGNGTSNFGFFGCWRQNPDFGYLDGLDWMRALISKLHVITECTVYKISILNDINLK